MSVAYGTFHQLGLFSQQYPPPLPPKPQKDNVRLQKLLKRTAKKKASTQTSQPATSFRSSLSPVNEASADLERSDHSTSPQTLETPLTLHSIQQRPRLTVRPLYQHVPSPYPQRAAFGRPVSMSPPRVAIPSHSFSHHITNVSFNSDSNQVSKVLASTDDVSLLGKVRNSLPSSFVSEVNIQTTELTSCTENPAFIKPVPYVGIQHSKTPSPCPTHHPGLTGQPVVRPLTILTHFIKSKSPRPTFKATEPSKSPKPMFEVPQIRMYTASTSYYETSRTPPVYDTAGLTAIGSTVPQSKTAETQQDLLTAFEIRGGRATTTATTTTLPPLLDTDPGRNIPTAEIKQVTPALEIQQTTPTSEIKRLTPTSEKMQVTATSEIKRVTQNVEATRSTHTAKNRASIPATEVRVQTPIYELLSSRRPKTPAYHIIRATTPVFEISNPNPLLFAVSPITVEPERSRSPQTISTINKSASHNLKTQLHETLLNGNVHSHKTTTDNFVKQNIKKSKSESDLTRRVPLASAVSSQRPMTPSSLLATHPVSGYQRPKTPTYEASRLLTTSPGFKKQKTITSNVSQVAFRRPKTPESKKSSSAYRGLTTTESSAYGGIKTYSPTFGITTSVISTKDDVKAEKEVSKHTIQDLIVIEQPMDELSKTNNTSMCEEKLNLGHVKGDSSATIPVIVVLTPDSTGTMSKQDPCTAPTPFLAKQETILTQEIPKAIDVVSENQKRYKPTSQTEVKDHLKSGKKDSLKEVKLLLSEEKGQVGEEKTKADMTADEYALKESKMPVLAKKIKDENSHSFSTIPTLNVEAPFTKSNGCNKIDNIEESSPDQSDKKGANVSPPAAASLINVMQKAKGMKPKMSGWSRLKEHMVVEQEEPQFPETGSQTEVRLQGQSEANKLEEQFRCHNEKQTSSPKDTETPKATKMWEAVLFQMFSSKENIMHQIELNKSEDENNEEKSNEQKEIPSFAFRLPVLLFSPRFDAKKLKEAACRPVTKISVVFEMGLIGRKDKEEEPKDFNRKARGYTAT